MSSLRRDKKDDEAENIFLNLDKTSVLQETRYFNETPVNQRKCTLVLTKILYLLNQGENLSSQEATDAFFATTKLFQSNDVVLRRMVYLCVKELSSTAEDVIIATSTLLKDMTGKEDLYRAAAIRALHCIADVTTLSATERYMKQAIVNKNPAVNSAALVSALHLTSTSTDLVRRWATECQEMVLSDSIMVSYHSLGVVAAAKKTDKHGMVKMVNKFVKSSLKSPYALCLLIRLAAKLVESDQSDTVSYEFIKSCLHHRSEMVSYEAANAIVNLKHSANDLTSAVSILQLFCVSPKVSLKFAGCRTLACLARTNPTAVAACSIDLENLIFDTNRSVATLAITTLLATCAESSIDRLIKQITTFVSEISDESKIIVISAIGRICNKFPGKHRCLAEFLANMLREQGSLEYKICIVNALTILFKEVLEAKETCMAHLCDFIEDCEHASLAIRILHLLGHEGPKSRDPSHYIRVIYNRMILESSPIRAAAVSAIAQFGAQRPELLPNIRVLISRCHLDDDDEVRFRAAYYLAILDTEDPELINNYIKCIPQPNFVLLEKTLRDYLATTPGERFDFMFVPFAKIQPENPSHVVERERKNVPCVSREKQFVDQIALVPGVESFGPIFKTNEPVELTEPETEYRVRCIKHVFPKHLLLQFECTNTLTDIILENAYVVLDHPHAYKLLCKTVCPRLGYNTSGNMFCVLELPEISSSGSTVINATMQFSARDCDATTGEVDSEVYADTYVLGEIEFGYLDQLRMKAYTENEWESSWKQSDTFYEVCDTFILPQQDVRSAAEAVSTHLGIQFSAITGDAVKLLRSGGEWRDGAAVLVRARFALIDHSVVMELTTRSVEQEAAQLIHAAI